MRRVNRCVRAALLAAAGLGLWASPSSGVVVGLKDRAVVATGGTLDAAFSGAITDNSITIYTNAVADTGLYAAGNSFWMNQGIATTTSIGTMLIQFDLAQLPGFGPGAVINKAELRVRPSAGNSGTLNLGYITTQDWAEGNKNNNYPGLNVTTPYVAPPAEGASLAHPRGLNSTTNRNADNTTGTSTSGSWGATGTTQFSIANDTAVDPATVQKTIAGGFRVWTVTDLVNAWAQGAVTNRGFAVLNTAYTNPTTGVVSNPNYQWYTSERGATDVNYEPTLFIDYTPAVPEPATLALVTMSGLMLLRRRW